MPSYDLLTYHDLTDTLHDDVPVVGQDAGSWFGADYTGLYVTAVGPGIHEGRVTVVLSHERRPEMQQEIKAYVRRR